MALTYASDKEKTLLEQFRQTQDVAEVMRDAWSAANRYSVNKAYFQITDSGVRYMFHMANTEGNVKVTLVAQQELFQK